ncbi:MAG: helix-turn-helix transcriptional regulator [Flavobacterium sp.]
MAVTKNPLTRYKILDEFFKNPYKKFTIEVLLETLNQRLFEQFGDESHCIKLRQLHEDIAFMKSNEGWNIEFADLKEGKKKIYQYENLDFSINKAPLNSVETEQFQLAIQTLSHFEGMPQFDGIQEIIAKLRSDLKSSEKPFIGFDNSQDLKGIEYFNLLYNAVQNKTPLEIIYKDFKTPEPYTYILYPHYLKQYNNRWFLFGYQPKDDKWNWNVAIDRIESVRQLDIPFITNDDMDWQEYFSDMIGVTKPLDAEIKEVVLHFSKLTGLYMANKSIHETQKHKWIDENTLELKIKVVLNYELERLILSYGESVKVIEPKDLADKIKQRHFDAYLLNS